MLRATPAAAAVIGALERADATVATAESLTGGLVAATLTAVPGASAVVRGGLVVYATDLKASLAGVPLDLLERDGPVAASTASAMADGVRDRCRATYGVATTGVAGPDPQNGHTPGTLHVAVAGPAGITVRSVEDLPGDRAEIRTRTVEIALDLLLETVTAAGNLAPRPSVD